MSARTDNQARHFLSTVSGLFKWAIANDLYDGRNPAEGITRTRSDGGDNDGHLAWPIELIEQYEKHWPVGTKQRLVFHVYLYVGLRRGDAARLGKQHIRRGIVHLMTEKSKGTMPTYVPVHPALAMSIKAAPRRGWRSSPRPTVRTIPRRRSATSFVKRSRRPAFRSPRGDRRRKAIPAMACARPRRPSLPRAGR